MAEAALPWVQGGLGALGLIQGKGAQRSANKAMGGVNAVNALSLETMRRLFGIADKYDPKKSTKIAVDAASDAASQTLDKSLRRIKMGGSPGDSEFHVSGQRATNDALDPLKLFTAEQTAQEDEKKAAMYQRVFGAPAGQMADSYFKQWAMYSAQANPTGSLAMLMLALSRLFEKEGGAGGSGDGYMNVGGYKAT